MLEYPACVKITQSISNNQYASSMKISSEQLHSLNGKCSQRISGFT